ncbi:hypothetical protein FB45DRAFT_866398 [Roridomyces roridus]|uniref:Uncharacterized protein n=1 Tax=Roridomyces roridus TaxID=1738132 RepID=A0AAD7B0Y7_9AGAR|nr:hypothetical protein FB45DRAFT_877656 [Roridomyces roridus]KAJ7632872.1 hypothetical protein FB45DRAFT_866398 [Roridomyces roridus]
MLWKYETLFRPKGRLLPITFLTSTFINFMGRRAVHLTQEEKRAAVKENGRIWSHKPGQKQARAAAKHSLRRRQGGETLARHRVPTTLLSIPAPPIEIRMLAETPLPTHEPHFQAALSSATQFDEEGLAFWKREPPFAEEDDTTDPYSDDYLRFTAKLVSIMHGIRAREERERAVELRNEFMAGQAREMLQTLATEVTESLLIWNRVRLLHYDSYHQSREHAMHLHYMQWLARTICTLYFLRCLN